MWDTISHFLSAFGLTALITAVTGYLLGSISFSIIFTRLFIHKDIRSFGSGNAGATNVLRKVGNKAAALNFVCDFAKAALSIILGSLIFQYAARGQLPEESVAVMGNYGAYLGGMTSLLGHLYPVYFQFRGGKGVIVTTAMMAMIDWRVFLVEFVIFAALFCWKKIVSFGSVVAAAAYPFTTFLITYFVDYRTYVTSGGTAYTLGYVWAATAITAIIGGVVILKHKENIKRLCHGEEKPISFKKKKEK